VGVVKHGKGSLLCFTIAEKCGEWEGEKKMEETQYLERDCGGGSSKNKRIQVEHVSNFKTIRGRGKLSQRVNLDERRGLRITFSKRTQKSAGESHITRRPKTRRRNGGKQG